MNNEFLIGLIEQLYDEHPNRFDHWLMEVDKEITGGDMVKTMTMQRDRILELEEKVKQLTSLAYDNTYNEDECPVPWRVRYEDLCKKSGRKEREINEVL